MISIIFNHQVKRNWNVEHVEVYVWIYYSSVVLLTCTRWNGCIYKYSIVKLKRDIIYERRWERHKEKKLKCRGLCWIYNIVSFEFELWWKWLYIRIPIHTTYIYMHIKERTTRILLKNVYAYMYYECMYVKIWKMRGKKMNSK